MEIEIILMLALFVFIIGILVALFVLIKKNMLEKEYQKNLDKYLDMINDSDDNDDEVDLISKPIGDEEIEVKDIKKETKEEKIEIKEETEKKVIKKDIKKINLELVNVLINKKSYTFLADGNKLVKNDKIKVKLKDKVYIGIVIKGNYLKEFNNNTKRPVKINLISKIDKKKEKENNKEVVKKEVIVDDFIPQKKRKKED